MNTFELLKTFQPGDGGNGANPDPVTCAQLTLQASLVLTGLKSIANAIASIQPGGGTAPDLTAVVNAINLLTKAVIGQGAQPEQDLQFLRVLVNRDPATDARTKALIDYFTKTEIFNANLSQVIGS